MCKLYSTGLVHTPGAYYVVVMAENEEEAWVKVKEHDLYIAKADAEWFPMEEITSGIEWFLE